MTLQPHQSGAKPVSLQMRDAIAYLQIERPESLNAINRDVLEALEAYIALLRNQVDIVAVVLSGAGEKAFVAGADIKEMQNLSAEEAVEFSLRGSQVFSALESLPQIVIARVQGFALGGGLELALAADFIVSSDTAKYGLPEVSLGLIPGFGGTQRLTRRIGMARALEWMSTGARYSATEAQAAGLVSRVVPMGELDSEINKLVSALAKNGPKALRSLKSVVRQGFEAPLETGLRLEASAFGLCFSREESQEGLSAFVEKRLARFRKL